MAVDTAGLLDKLAQLNISYVNHTHPPVLTIDAQVKELGDVGATPVKNLFLKDKKGRLYIITALPNTTVDLKVLSARLGLGKGGIRMAPDELLGSVLQVGPGSVTPFALVQATAAGVVLLLDHKIKAQPKIIAHPLTNTMSTAMTPDEFETFLGSIERGAIYVDLEACPQIDKDNPPDLKQYADNATVVAQDANPAPGAAPEKAVKAASKPQKAPSTKEAKSSTPAPKLDDVHKISETLISKVKALVGSDMWEQLDQRAQRSLELDFQVELKSLKNICYADGFKCGQGQIASYISKQFA